MDYSVIEINRNDQHQQSELVRFLSDFKEKPMTPEFWSSQLAHWWDKNPFYAPGMPKGWILTFQGNTVGFLGVLAFTYLYQSGIHKALATTTWRVDPAHRNHSLALYMTLHSLKDQYIILNTTPTPKVSSILTEMGYLSSNMINNYIFPVRQSGASFLGIWLNAIRPFTINGLPDKEVQTVTLADEFRFEEKSFSAGGLRKLVTRESLYWYCNSPALQKSFIGTVDEQGLLTAYMIGVRKKLKGMEVFRIIDHFSSDRENKNLLALAREVSGKPELMTGLEGSHLLMLTSFSSNDIFEKKPWNIINRKAETVHYYTLPEHLEGCPKYCLKAEGDYGL